MKKLEKILKKIQPVDKNSFEKTQKQLDNLTKPAGSLGRLEEISKIVVAITGKEKPKLNRKVVFVFAGDHGVTEENISAYPKEVTAQMVYNFIRGGAGINVLSRHEKVDVVVADLGVAQELLKTKKLKIKKIAYGTKNFTKGPAMTKEEAIKSIEAGIEIFEEEYARKKIDIVATGDMGIGNTTSSSAITSVITGSPVELVTGKGTGIDHAQLRHKIEIIKKAISVNKPEPKNAIDVLSKLGGFEIGGIVGVILAGAAKKIPVVIDGFISGASALIAVLLNPLVKDYLIAGHISEEPGHKIQLEYLELKPILNLNMRLGEGTGAVLAMNIIDAACKILNEMATFESAGVSKKKS
ncbi:MAG: nicotinate-nucleotide--dimethylbenzimidazole phosphoribosyltransferase [Endomicrobiia bacterium]